MQKMFIGLIVAAIVILTAVSVYSFPTISRRLDNLERKAEVSEKAQLTLGFIYEHGDGVAQDYAEALKWYRFAAELGSARGQLNVGRMYDYGFGVPTDMVQAVKWFRLAADQGNTDAQYSLALRYFRGQGVPQDYVQAYKWYSLAASRYPSAIGGRDAVAAKMTPTQIAEAQKLSSKWKPK